MHYLFWALLALSIYGGIEWFLHDRPVRHPAGMITPDEPRIVVGETRSPWQGAHGFRYRALADFDGRAVVLSRTNYSMGEFAGLSPTDLAIAWGPLSDPVVYHQFAFSQMGSPFAGRFVFPSVRSGSGMAARPFPQVVALLLDNLTHVHTIPADDAIAGRLAGIRPGQAIALKGVLVEAMAPSGGIYASSLKLHDYDCEILWVDEITLL